MIAQMFRLVKKRILTSQKIAKELLLRYRPYFCEKTFSGDREATLEALFERAFCLQLE